MSVLLLEEVRLTAVTCRPPSVPWYALGSPGAFLVMDEVVSEVWDGVLGTGLLSGWVGCVDVLSSTLVSVSLDLSASWYTLGSSSVGLMVGGQYLSF